MVPTATNKLFQRFISSTYFFASFRYSVTGEYLRQPVIATDQTVASREANSTEGLAYDWVNKNLYWVNTEPASINVISNNGQFPSVKILKNLDRPRGLAVDPKEAYV